jgi:hypothetical protein
MLQSCMTFRTVVGWGKISVTQEPQRNPPDVCRKSQLAKEQPRRTRHGWLKSACVPLSLRSHQKLQNGMQAKSRKISLQFPSLRPGYPERRHLPCLVHPPGQDSPKYFPAHSTPPGAASTSWNQHEVSRCFVWRRSFLSSSSYAAHSRSSYCGVVIFQSVPGFSCPIWIPPLSIPIGLQGEADRGSCICLASRGELSSQAFRGESYVRERSCFAVPRFTMWRCSGRQAFELIIITNRLVNLKLFKIATRKNRSPGQLISVRHLVILTFPKLAYYVSIAFMGCAGTYHRYV